MGTNSAHTAWLVLWSEFCDAIGIELCDAVNEVVKVPYHSLHKLGGNLELDEDRICAILATTQYEPEEKRQRLVEMWFRKESEPTWERLNGTVAPLLLTREPTSSRLGESSTSMDGVPVLSPTLTSKTILLAAHFDNSYCCYTHRFNDSIQLRRDRKSIFGIIV